MNFSGHAPFISIVVPILNEAGLIAESIMAFKDLKNFELEVLLVVEKCEDATLAIINKSVGADPRFKILAQEKQEGKGAAVRTGMLAANGSYVFFMDADLSTSLAEIRNFVKYFEAQPELDILIGSRKHPKSQIVRPTTFFRRLSDSIFNLLVRTFVFPGIHDTQCGFKAFRRRAVRPLFLHQRTLGFSFDVEILLLARGLNYRFAALPVEWQDSGNSEVRIFQDSLKMVIELFRIKPGVQKTLSSLQMAKEVRSIRKSATASKFP